MAEHPSARRTTAPSGKQASRTHLDVPYAEKDAAKALGARWDPKAKRCRPRAGSPTSAPASHLRTGNDSAA